MISGFSGVYAWCARGVLVNLGTCQLHIFANSLDALKADAQPPFAVCCSLGELHMSWGSAQLATLVFSDGVGPSWPDEQRLEWHLGGPGFGRQAVTIADTCRTCAFHVFLTCR